jgi:hypothetical protein
MKYSLGDIILFEKEDTEYTIIGILEKHNTYVVGWNCEAMGEFVTDTVHEDEIENYKLKIVEIEVGTEYWTLNSARVKILAKFQDRSNNWHVAYEYYNYFSIGIKLLEDTVGWIPVDKRLL